MGTAVLESPGAGLHLRTTEGALHKGPPSNLEREEYAMYESQNVRQRTLDPFFLTFLLIRRGSVGNDVRFAQKMFALFMPEDYGSLVADGIFGFNTESAAIEFQEHNGLTADGIIGSVSWNRLAPTVSIDYHYWGKEKAIHEVQRLLAEGGHLSEDDVDGQFGRKTEAAIMVFQLKYDLMIDGKWGPQCWNIAEQGYR